jgi:hypothetical protein
LRLDANYSDAMAYLNLLYRLKSGIVDNPVEAADLMVKADQWVGKALAAKRPRDLHQAGPEEALLSLIVAPPPPPPPPPPQAIRDDQFATASAPRPRNAAERPAPYWQVMGDPDTPANTLIRQLREKGFRAGPVLSAQDNLVRVMVGPFPEAEALAHAKGALEAAGVHPIRVW